MIKDIISWIPAVTYLVVIGEAMALLFGLVIAKKQSPWNSRKNQTLLILDIVLGWSTFLILLMDYSGLLILIPTTLLLLSHAYRIIEMFFIKTPPFCFNQSLSMINLAKFVGLAISIYIFI
jgi:hypothetical protein